jgi:hypothetical protein
MVGFLRVRWLLGVCAALFASTVSAVELVMNDGSVVTGEIAWTAGETVFLKDAEARLQLCKKSRLSAASLTEVAAWEAAHPDQAELPSKFDQAPKLLKKRVPPRGELQGVTDAVIMLALVVASDGSVEQVLVKDSSDDRIVSPTCEAVRHWKFAPLEINETPTRGVLFMPVQF